MHEGKYTLTITERELLLLDEALLRWIVSANDAMSVFAADKEAFDHAIFFRNELSSLRTMLCELEED